MCEDEQAEIVIYAEAGHSKDKTASCGQQHKAGLEESAIREVSFEQQDESDATSTEIEMLQAAAGTVSQQTEKAEGIKSAYFEASHSKDKKASYSQQKDEFEEVEIREVSFEQQDESDPTSAEIEAANTGFEQMEETKDMEKPDRGLFLIYNITVPFIFNRF
ncbi:unnamed protein product [Gongylonema pulchrum]|uniref:Si:ch211-116m6.3 n=1 Tax=Gongylonema pulchrum TaxID=637853 RepID=A0A183F1G7_9BILA|nr:unnamed protein product [Gongylonema pulchrum]